MKKSAFLLSLFLCFSFWVQAQEYGLASFYSDKFQDRPTASGELYDKDKLTAAHKTHPYGTYIRVTRLDNKKSVVVRVNDRGPYISGRVVDVSKKAADQLGLTADGTARVKVEVVSKPDASEPATVSAPAPTTTAPKEVTTPPTTTTTPATDKPKVETPKTAEPVAKVEEKPKTATPATTPPSNTGTSAKGLTWVTEKNFQSYDLYKIELYKPEKTGFTVQLSSLSSYDGAMRQIAELQGKGQTNVLISIEKGPNTTVLYKIMLGPYPDRKAAEAKLKSIKKQYRMDGFIVDISTIAY